MTERVRHIYLTGSDHKVWCGDDLPRKRQDRLREISTRRVLMPVTEGEFRDGDREDVCEDCVAAYSRVHG